MSTSIPLYYAHPRARARTCPLRRGLLAYLALRAPSGGARCRSKAAAPILRGTVRHWSCRWHSAVVWCCTIGRANLCGAARYSSDVEATGVTVLVAKRADARKCHAARQARRSALSSRNACAASCRCAPVRPWLARPRAACSQKSAACMLISVWAVECAEHCGTGGRRNRLGNVVGGQCSRDM